MLQLTINGREHRVDAAPDAPLLWILRDHLDMPGTKFGCGVALCGACTVHIDGQPVQQAWEALDVPQCGYCQSGQIMSATALLANNPRPDDAAITAAMDGNICRCGTYSRIRQAIRDAATALEG